MINLLQIALLSVIIVKEFRKSINIWQIYVQQYSVHFFLFTAATAGGRKVASEQLYVTVTRVREPTTCPTAVTSPLLDGSFRLQRYNVFHV